MQVASDCRRSSPGLVTFASAVGAMGMKTSPRASSAPSASEHETITPSSARFSRRLRAFTAARSCSDHDHPGGRRFLPPLQFTAINTVAYAEVEPAQMSRPRRS